MSLCICGTTEGKQKTHLSDNMINGSYKCRPGGNRTLDPMIKSHVLCQLSYGPVLAAN